LNKKILLKVIKGNKDFQVLDITMNGLLDPEDIRNLQLPKGIDYTKGVIISGKSPVWLFSYLVHLLHISKWVATFDPRKGAIVVQSHDSKSPQAGDVIPLDDIKHYFGIHESTNKIKKKPGKRKNKIIAFVGPPHSGKSVFLNLLSLKLSKRWGWKNFQKYFYIIRACPDGEGDWYHDVPEQLGTTLRYKTAFDEGFVSETVLGIKTASENKKILFIDCGGKIDKKNQRILNECNCVIIVSRDKSETLKWMGAISSSNLELLYVINSVLTKSYKRISKTEYELGPLIRFNKGKRIPACKIPYNLADALIK